MVPTTAIETAEIDTLEFRKWEVGMFVVYDQSDPADNNLALRFSLGVVEAISFPETGGATLDIVCCGYKTATSIRSEVGLVYKCVCNIRKDKNGEYVWRKVDSVAPSTQYYKKVVCQISSDVVHWCEHFSELFERGKGTSMGVFLKACVVNDCLSPKLETNLKQQKM
jgi:hypothetical protein